MRRSIKKHDLAIYAMYLAIFKIYQIPEILQQCMKIVLLVVVAFYLFSRSSAKQLINRSIPLGVSVVISGIFSYRVGVIPLKSVFDAILHAICLYMICSLMNYCARKNYQHGLINCLYKITSVYCVISLFSIAIMTDTGNKSEIVYFFGYKFMTSYYFIFWLALYSMKYSDQIHRKFRAKVVYLFATLAVLLVCLWVDCATSIIAVFFVLFWQFMPVRILRILKRKLCAIVLVIAAGVLPFFLGYIMEKAFIQNFVQNILGRRLSLTGRMPIYMMLWTYIKQRPWIGYGYGNTVIFQHFGYGNAQNGLLEHLLSYGFVGVAILIWLLHRNLKGGTYRDAKIEGWYTIFYALVIASTVEISFNYIFYMAMFAIGSFGQSAPKGTATLCKTHLKVR